MTLRIATPWKHPKTGVYWFRKWVPERLRPKLGTGMYQRSLRTKNVEEAKAKFAVVAAEIATKWEALSAEPGRLTPIRRWGIAGEYYRWFLAEHENDLGTPSHWEMKINFDLFGKKAGFRRPSTAHHLMKTLPKFLSDRGIPVDERDLFELAEECVDAGVLAKRTLMRRSKGDFSVEPEASRFPPYTPPPVVKTDGGRTAVAAGTTRVTLASDWDAFVAERGLSPGTQKRWRPLLAKLQAHVGRQDLATVTAAEIGDWKRLLLASDGLSHKTVREAYVAAARSFFSWAVGSGKMAANPCAGITVAHEKVIETTATRGRDLTDAEANLILSETLRPPNPKVSATFAHAKRWIPWLCAYTGARVNELTQLRRQDLIKHEIGEHDVWVIRITPEAGSVKSGKIREVPLHSHLIDMGFHRFVAEREDGPLFYKAERPRGGSAENPPYKKVGEKLAAWVREIGVDDPGVDPSHGWRHRFKTVARLVEMNEEVREGVAGHAPRTIGEAYGSIPLSRKYGEIQRFPRYDVLAPIGELPDTKARRARNGKRAATTQRARQQKAAAAGSPSAAASPPA